MSFTAPTRDRSGPVLPLAGMVDVLFLLLIFFVTASVFREQDQAIDVSLPQAESAIDPNRALATPVVVTIDKDGKVYLGDRVHDDKALTDALTSLFEANADQTLIVRADRTATVDPLVRVIDIAYTAGLTNVQVATTKTAGDL